MASWGVTVSGRRWQEHGGHLVPTGVATSDLSLGWPRRPPVHGLGIPEVMLITGEFLFDFLIRGGAYTIHLEDHFDIHASLIFSSLIG